MAKRTCSTQHNRRSASRSDSVLTAGRLRESNSILARVDVNRHVPEFGAPRPVIPHRTFRTPVRLPGTKRRWKRASHRILSFSASLQALAGGFAFLWVPLCWVALAGILTIPWLPNRRQAVALAWVPVSCILACSFAEDFQPRYNAAVTPFVAAVALFPITWFVGRWISKAGAPRSNRSEPSMNPVQATVASDFVDVSY
jgi:hypothetical protein